MRMTRLSIGLVAAVAFAAGLGVRGMGTSEATVQAAAANRVFEIRTYTAAPGKFEALKARFRDHTIKVFDRFNMTSIGYWVPQDSPQSENTLIYVIAHPSREAAKANWAAFSADPEWQKARNESQKDGPILAPNGVTSVFLNPTDFSPVK